MRQLKIVLTAFAAVSVALFAACDDGGSDDGSNKSDRAEKESASTSEKADTGESSDDSDLPFRATGPVAVVNGTEITKEDFNEVVEKRFGNSRRPVPKPMAEKLKNEALESMIDKRLIEAELEKSDVSATDAELEEAFQDFRDNFPTDQKYQDFLDKTGTSEKEMKGNISKDVRLKKILREKKGIEVTEKDAKEYYEKNKDRYKEPEKVKARHILIKTDNKSEKEAKKKAEELLKKAKKEGTDFAELAEKHSEGPSARKGGDLGFFSKDRMVDAFAEKAFSMEDGQIAGPVKTNHGFHVIKREEYKEANTESFESVKSEIIDQLETEKFRKAIDEYTQKLRDGAEIEKMSENIEVTASGGGMGGLGGLKGALKKGGLKGKGGKKLKLKQLKKGGGSKNLKLKKPESLKE